jgi:hypothetical protein
MGIKEIWRDPVWSKVISNAIWLALASGSAWALAHWWKAVLTSVAWAWTYTTGDAAVPRWLLWSLLLWTGFTLVFIVIRLVFSSSSPVASWRSYTKDDFHRMTWRWRYDESGTVYSLHAFCPRCDYQLDMAEDLFSYQHPRLSYVCTCGETHLQFNDTRYDFEKTIHQKIRKLEETAN